jgi:hypothetical protein
MRVEEGIEADHTKNLWPARMERFRPVPQSRSWRPLLVVERTSSGSPSDRSRSSTLWQHSWLPGARVPLPPMQASPWSRPQARPSQDSRSSLPDWRSRSARRFASAGSRLLPASPGSPPSGSAGPAGRLSSVASRWSSSASSCRCSGIWSWRIRTAGSRRRRRGHWSPRSTSKPRSRRSAAPCFATRSSTRAAGITARTTPFSSGRSLS